MKKYLLDTNAYFEMLSFLAGKNIRSDGYDFEDIQNGECYISKITELEILSVIGKYGRGEASQWQKCTRQIHADGTECNYRYFHKGRRPWNKKLCRDMQKLVKEMITGSSPILKVNVLDVNETIIERAEGFMMHASKHKFGSQDALIVATSIICSSQEEPLIVVTSDRALRAAMIEEGVGFIVPGYHESMKNE